MASRTPSFQTYFQSELVRDFLLAFPSSRHGALETVRESRLEFDATSPRSGPGLNVSEESSHEPTISMPASRRLNQWVGTIEPMMKCLPSLEWGESDSADDWRVGAHRVVSRWLRERTGSKPRRPGN
ncbi:MAG: hypothetical protein R3B96_17065 [Pirellulaceae bacterium]